MPWRVSLQERTSEPPWMQCWAGSQHPRGELTGGQLGALLSLLVSLCCHCGTEAGVIVQASVCKAGQKRDSSKRQALPLSSTAACHEVVHRLVLLTLLVTSHSACVSTVWRPVCLPAVGPALAATSSGPRVTSQPTLEPRWSRPETHLPPSIHPTSIFSSSASPELFVVSTSHPQQCQLNHPASGGGVPGDITGVHYTHIVRSTHIAIAGFPEQALCLDGLQFCSFPSLTGVYPVPCIFDQFSGVLQ